MKPVWEILDELGVRDISDKDYDLIVKRATKMFNEGGGKWQECVEMVLDNMKLIC